MVRVLIVMGVSGSGKSTLAKRIAQHLQCDAVVEADHFHPANNREKMRAGIPLSDDDRWPWLAQLNEYIRSSNAALQVVACSALKVSYRKRLMQGLEGEVHFLFLDAPQEVLARHHRDRVHEYMPASLLESQLNTLERPVLGEPVSVVSVTGSENESFLEILEVLRRLGISR